MLIEYVSSKLSSVRWKSQTHQGRGQGNVVVAGTCDNGVNNKITVWSVDTSGSALELQRKHEVAVSGDVTRICTFLDRFVAASTTRGDLLLYNLPETELLPVTQWKGLHGDAATDVMFLEGTKELVSCGEDGYLSVVRIDGKGSKTSAKISETNLECVDILTPQQVVCGNSSGYLKVYDTRLKSTVQSLAGALSAVLCLTKNPSNSHIIASGNEAGEVCLWDLRKSSSLLIKLEAHSSSITDMHYDQRDGSALFTSANDGQILKWTISPEFAIDSVDRVFGRPHGPPVGSFHTNLEDEIVFATDNEVLGVGRL